MSLRGYQLSTGRRLNPDDLLEVDGFTAADPIEDDDWLDFVRWELNYQWQAKREHNRDGYLCYEAGTAECLALGHELEPTAGNDDFDPDERWGHVRGWDYSVICPATRYADACTECESADCEWEPWDPSRLWKAVSA